MAYKQQTIRYEFGQEAKAAMIMILEQFSEHMTTVHELKNMLMVDGAIVLESDYAVLLACLITDYYPLYVERLMRPIDKCPRLSPSAWAARYHELVSR